jgi:hypothetical protein
MPGACFHTVPGRIRHHDRQLQPVFLSLLPLHQTHAFHLHDGSQRNAGIGRGHVGRKTFNGAVQGTGPGDRHAEGAQILALVGRPGSRPDPQSQDRRCAQPAQKQGGLFYPGRRIIGFFTGFLFAAYTSVQWDLIVSGKPVVALVPFFIVGFEFTILFSVIGNVIGLINVGGLPDWEGLAEYDPRCSGEHYGITAACDPVGETNLRQFFQDRGAEVATLETSSQPA